MLVLNRRRTRVYLPLTVHDVFVLVGPRSEGQADSEEHLSVLTPLPIQFLKSLPLFPAAGYEYFFGEFLLRGFPDEIGLLGGTRPEMVIPAVRAGPRHKIQII